MRFKERIGVNPLDCTETKEDLKKDIVYLAVSKNIVDKWWIIFIIESSNFIWEKG